MVILGWPGTIKVGFAHTKKKKVKENKTPCIVHLLPEVLDPPEIWVFISFFFFPEPFVVTGSFSREYEHTEEP